MAVVAGPSSVARCCWLAFPASYSYSAPLLPARANLRRRREAHLATGSGRPPLAAVIMSSPRAIPNRSSRRRLACYALENAQDAVAESDMRPSSRSQVRSLEEVETLTSTRAGSVEVYKEDYKPKDDLFKAVGIGAVLGMSLGILQHEWVAQHEASTAQPSHWSYQARAA
eukprot:jgi/Chlat1/539/Chrsp103S08598